MARESDELGDSRSREDNRTARDSFDRGKAGNPLYAYAPRWVPTPSWRMSLFDLIIFALGIGIIVMVLGLRLLGIIGGS